MPYASDDPSNDRRESRRHRSVLRVVKIERESGFIVAQLCNISDEGMMLSVNVPIEVDEHLTVHFCDQHKVAGRVAWTDKGRCGVELDVPIDSLALLRDLAAEQRAHTFRSPRVDAALLGVAYSEMGVHPVRTTNLSQKGMGLRHDGRFKPGLQLLVMLENGIERRGVVRWSQDFSAGLQLLEPLACEELNRCVEMDEDPPA